MLEDGPALSSPEVADRIARSTSMKPLSPETVRFLSEIESAMKLTPLNQGLLNGWRAF
jgi:hypothetical protein